MKITTLFGLVIFLVSGHLFAQKVNDKFVASNIKLNALRVISSYEDNCAIINDDEYDLFVKSFSDPSKITLPNDVIPDNRFEQKVSINEYADKLLPLYHTIPIMVSVQPYNIVVENQNREGVLYIDAIKIVSSETKEFSSYADTFDLRFSIAYNYTESSYKITDISLNSPKGKFVILEAFRKINKDTVPLINDSIIINKSTVVLNSEGRYILKDQKSGVTHVFSPASDELTGVKNITYEDISAASNKNTERNIIRLYFKQPAVFFQPYIGFMPIGSMSNITLSNPDIVKTNNFGLCIGLGMNYLLKSTPKSYWSFKTGIEFNILSYHLNLNSFAESHEATDPDLSSYTRTNTLSNISEKGKLNILSVPIQLTKGFKISKKIGVFSNFGFNLCYVNAATYTATANALYSGYYKDLYGITIAENGVYDFGKYDLNRAGNLDVQKSFICYNLGAGLTHKLNKTVSFLFGLGYKSSLSSIIKETNGSVSKNSNEYRSISSQENSVRLSIFSLDLGLKIAL